MISRRLPPEEDDSTAVEFLEGVTSTPADATTGANRRWPAALGIVAVATLGLGSLMLSTQAPPNIAELHAIEVHFGDAFEIEWTDLAHGGEPAIESTRPKPMASTEPACLGFARPDWPAERRHPSVAHCINAESLDQLIDDDDVGAWQIVAGTDTWYLLYFPTPIEQFEAHVDNSSPLGPDRIHQGDSFVAIAVPTSSSDLTLTWNLRVGPSYRCHLDRLSAQPPTCA